MNQIYNQFANNPYLQQLDAIRQQLQTPQFGVQQQQPPALNLQQIIQQEVQRQLQQPQYAQQQYLPAPQPVQQVPPAVALLSAIGAQMTVGDQQWLSANIAALPGFFGTNDGKELVALAVSGFKRHMGVTDD